MFRNRKIKKKIEGIICWNRIVTRERKRGFVEKDMPGSDDTPGGKVEATEAAMGCRVAEKDTRTRAGRKLVRGGGGEIRVAQATEDAKV
jgi:hypothetical protein